MSTPEELSLLHSKAIDFWLARASVALIAALQLLLINNLSVGPRWLAPTIELSLLLPLSLATAWQQHHARRASTESHWAFIANHRRIIRRAAVLLTAVISVMNFGALWQLVQALLHGGKPGSTLLVDALNVWVINTVTFALWYWAIDRGGPAARTVAGDRGADFLFPQTTVAGPGGPPFMPGFVDYLFVAFTNATAFSPTDTLPISQRAKLLMMAQALASLITVALVTARAVNILT